MARFILSEVAGRVGLITLNRPDVLNALNPEMEDELGEQVQRWNADPAIGAIVLTGAGRAFCSGVDAITPAAGEPALAGRHPRDGRWAALARASKPIICAINGAAVGEGLAMALHCDLRVASEDARLSFRFIRLEPSPAPTNTHVLPQLVGLGTAMELLLTGRFIDGREAAALGLVNHVFPPESLISGAIALAESIAAHPETQVGYLKRMVYEHYADGDPGWAGRGNGSGGRATADSARSVRRSPSRNPTASPGP